MATHSSTLASKIPWTEEPGGLQSMSLRVTKGIIVKIWKISIGSYIRLLCYIAFFHKVKHIEFDNIILIVKRTA